MLPMADVAAAAEPDMAPKNMLAITFTKASPAGNFPTSTRGKIDQSHGNPSTVHNSSGQHKKGNGQQCKTIQSRGHPVGIGGKGRQGINGHQHGQDPGNSNTESNGDTDDQKNNKTEDKNKTSMYQDFFNSRI